jgi:hypothetical protein
MDNLLVLSVWRAVTAGRRVRSGARGPRIQVIFTSLTRPARRYARMSSSCEPE